MHLLSYTVHKIRHVALPLPIENLYNIPYLFGKGGLISEVFFTWVLIKEGANHSPDTLPTAEILSVKNARAWVLMVLYLKKINEN